MAELPNRMTLSLLRFDEPRRAPDLKVDGALYSTARIAGVTAEGSMSDRGTVCAALSVFANDALADLAFDRPSQLIGGISGVADSAHLKLRPTAHRGAINWLNSGTPDEVFQTSEPGLAPDEPVAVLTTIGYESLPEQPRLDRLLQNDAQMLEEMVGVAGLIFHNIFIPNERFEDGFTISLWRDSASMESFAYASDIHVQRLEAHREEPFFDRASFTRFAIERTTAEPGRVPKWYPWGE